jgi:predicted CoA-substrate-specific enzyme activase
MVVAGIDIGAITTKVVLMNEQKIESYVVIKSRVGINQNARECFEQVLQNSGYKRKEVTSIVATGYGRINIPFAHKCVTEITCHAKGAHWLNPAVRTIIDIGGQDSKVISISESGQVIDFMMNDKCAAGTGRFLEVMAQALEVALEDLGELSLQSKKKVHISSMCTVFAESEVISLIADGYRKEDIIHGLHESITNRIYSMVVRLPVTDVIALTGGVAKNKGIILSFKKKIKKKLYLPPEPQIVGAIGAALIAHDLAK